MNGLARAIAQTEAELACLQAKQGRLDAVTQRLFAVRRAEDALLTAIVEARREEASWEEIGDALGTTRQGAWDRYARKVARRLPGPR